MEHVRLHDKKQIEQCLRKDLFRNIYAIGDLDDFYWPYTAWYGLHSEKELTTVALVYSGTSLPILVAFSLEGDEGVAALVQSIQPLLPPRFCAHLSPGMARVLKETHHLETGGEHYRMALMDEAKASGADCSGVDRLGLYDLASILELYEASYPENWFDPRMLETGCFFGIRQDYRLVSIAGVHVYSKEYRVAALGSIATLPACRGKGYATRVTARLCRALVDEKMHIGLNVKADNEAAIACYRKIGFQKIASYEEYLAEKNTGELS